MKRFASLGDPGSGPQRLGLHPYRHLQPVEHLLGHDLPEVGLLAVELAQDALGERALGGGVMLGDQGAELGDVVGHLDALEDHHVGVDAALELIARVPDIGHAAAHAGGEVVADRAEQDGDTTGHVLAAIVAAALDHGRGTGVADGEALAGATGGEELASGGAVEAGVADDGVVGPDDRRGG